MEPLLRSHPSRALVLTGAVPPATAPPWSAQTGTNGLRERSAEADQEDLQPAPIPASPQPATMAPSHHLAGPVADDGTSILGRLALRVIKVGRNRDHGVLDLPTKKVLGN